MTTTELQALFKHQLDAGLKKVFYMIVEGGPEVHQITGKVLTHSTEQASFDDLLNSLTGYTYQDSIGESQWPRFKKD